MMRKYLRKYFIMGSQNCKRDPSAILLEAIKGGITAFQYREKGKGSLKDDDKITLGKELRHICREYNIPFFINDNIELVDILEADGIHVGQNDISVEVIRERYPTTLVGLSISNESQFKNSSLHLIDYIGAGPSFPTRTKKDANTVAGLDWLTYIRQEQPDMPLVAIGGINETNAKDVLKAGADGVAVISAITDASNIKQVLKHL